MFPGISQHAWRYKSYQRVTPGCGGEKNKSIGFSVKKLYSHSLPMRILDVSLYFWEKQRCDSSPAFCHCHCKGYRKSLLCKRGIYRLRVLHKDWTGPLHVSIIPFSLVNCSDKCHPPDTLSPSQRDIMPWASCLMACLMAVGLISCSCLWK